MSLAAIHSQGRPRHNHAAAARHRERAMALARATLDEAERLLADPESGTEEMEAASARVDVVLAAVRETRG